MRDRQKKQALATVFGIVKRDGLVTGIPGDVPKLRKAVTCPTCKIKLAKGLPVMFESYMTEAQKAHYRDLIGYKPPKETEG